MKTLGYIAILLLLVVSLFAGSAFAQCTYPVNPTPANTQTTPFSNNYFSLTFNGPVTTDAPDRNAANTSTTYSYSSFSNGVYQAAHLRIIDHDIAVDYTSSDFYADDDRTGGTIENRSKDSWCGHPFTYTGRKVVNEKGETYFVRTRYIIVSARAVLFLVQVSSYSAADQPEWMDFEYSLRIK